MKNIISMGLMLSLTFSVLAEGNNNFWQYVYNKSNAGFSSQENKNIVNQVRSAYKHNVKELKENYSNARVLPINDEDILVILNKKNISGFDLDRVDLHTLKVYKNIPENTLRHMRNLMLSPPVCPDESVQFVVSVYDPSKSEGNNGAMGVFVSKLAKKAGYKVKELYGKQDTSQKLLNYLSCENVVGAYDDGNGADYGIETADGIFTSKDVTQYLSNKLFGKTFILGDGEVLSGSFKDSIINDGKASKMIGGLTTLWTILANAMSTCVANLALEKEPLQNIGSLCQAQYGYTKEYHTLGTAGNGKEFDDGNIPHVLSKGYWGAMSYDGSYSGTVLNQLVVNDNSKSAIAAEHAAEVFCVKQGGTIATCSTRNNHSQFEFCGSLFTDDDSNYGYMMGYGMTTSQSDKAASIACTLISRDQGCHKVWSDCNNGNVAFMY